MERKLKYVSPKYEAQLDDLSETLAASRRLRLGDAALQDTVEFPAINEQLLLDYDQEHLVRGAE